MDTILQFFWDVGSPYTYIAQTQLSRLEAGYHVNVVYRPFLLGGVFKAAGNQAPAQVPAKGKYLFKDLHDCARYLNVPISMPSMFPANSLKAMRVAVFADTRQKGKEYAEAILKAYWVQGLNPAEDSTISDVLHACAMDPEEALAAATDSVVKDRLRANTEEAVERGAFGAPTFFLDEEMFWGHDRLDIIASRLTKR